MASVSERLSLEDAARRLRRLTAVAAGSRTRVRIELLLTVVEEGDSAESDIDFGRVVHALFGEHPRGATRFREFRHTLMTLAKAQGADIVLDVDGQKHAPMHERRCWFLGSPEVTGIERTSERATKQPPGTVEVRAFAEVAGDRRAVTPIELQPLTEAGDHDTRMGKRSMSVEVPHPGMGELPRSSSEPSRGDGRGRDWSRLLTERETYVVDARAQQASLNRCPPESAGDATVDVQSYLREWAEREDSPPYLVIFGEYGMGKTTACHAFTRELLRHRREGERVRLPIYLDLRRLGDVKQRDPTLGEILDDLLPRVWQTGDLEPAARATDVIGQVQLRRAVVIFDGLDEVLVHLSETKGQALLRELWKILPPDLAADPATRGAAGRVILTCRPHYFRTIREQHTYFRGEEREQGIAESYAALHLLPFTREQVRSYLEHRRDAHGGVDRALDLIDGVYNLAELVQRPFNLRLIVDQLAAIERRIAAGEDVSRAALYEDLTATWLDRDEGKHQIPRQHKTRLMEEFAATLWQARRRSLPVDELEEWLHRRLDTNDELGRWFRLSPVDVAVLAEDLRTATFIIRPGADEFEFAHTSLLEFFLARHLARALAESDVAAWALPMPTVETLDFLAEIVASGDTQRCIDGLRRLRCPYRPDASELAFRYCVRANSRGRPALPLSGFALDRAKLSHLELLGPEQGPPLRVTDCTFTHADLRNARLERVRLEHCDLSAARLDNAEAHSSTIQSIVLDDADLTGFLARNARLVDLDLTSARAHRTQWIRCQINNVRWPKHRQGHIIAGARNQRFPEVSPDQARLASFTGHTGWVGAVAWSPDGTRLATTGGGDASVRIWDARAGEELLTLIGHTGWVGAVAWSPDGTRLASAGGGSVRIWDAHAGDEVLTLANVGSVESVAWSPDGARLACAGGDAPVCVWNPRRGEQLLTLGGHTGSVGAVAWSPDGVCLATAGDDALVRVWDARAGEELFVLRGHEGWVRAVAWSPDGVRLATAGGGEALVRILDARTGEELLGLPGHTGWVGAVAWSPDGTCLATGSGDGLVRVWDARAGAELLGLPGHTSWVGAVAWSPDGTRLATGSGDASVRIWDAQAVKQLLTLIGHTNWVRAVAWSPDGTRLATGSDDASVRVWDARAGEELLVLRGHEGWVRALAWSPDGARLATGGDTSVRVWDTRTGEELLGLPGHTGWVGAVAWSADGVRLATGGGDALVRVWDARTGEELLTLGGHTGWVGAVAWSADGVRLATGGGDALVRVWDARAGEELLVLSGHTDWVRAVAWSSDGKRLATAGSDTTVRIWSALRGVGCLTIYAFDHGESAVGIGGKLVTCSQGAWRWLGWLAPDPTTASITRFPAEIFGSPPDEPPRV